MRTIRSVLAVTAIGLLVASLAATPASAETVSSTVKAKASTTLTYRNVAPTSVFVTGDLPQAVRDKVAEINRAGGSVVKISRADYRLASKVEASTQRLDSFPSGCGLFVTIYRSGSNIISSNLTSCTSIFTYVEMYGGIGRSRFLGQWETMTTHEGEEYYDTSFGMDFSYNCAGTGTHDFQAVTNGYLEIFGNEYTASAYDIINSQSC